VCASREGRRFDYETARALEIDFKKAGALPLPAPKNPAERTQTRVFSQNAMCLIRRVFRARTEEHWHTACSSMRKFIFLLNPAI
jgi:hypothetical protein